MTRHPPLTIAMTGTRGVPARYGGFETAVQEVGSRLAARGHRVVVYCRGDRSADRHLGMELVHLPAVRRRNLETLSHTALSVGHLLATDLPDAVILFNAANSPLLPLLRLARVPVAVHVDGLEWQRNKWGPFARRYHRAAERLAVRYSDSIIADARGIADYYFEQFGAATDLLSYGAPLIHPRADRLAEYGLEPNGYHLVVARFEPENNVLSVVDGYVSSAATKPLVVVGSAPYSDSYIAAVHAAADDRVRFMGSVWDPELLDQLYGNSLTYLHGHSVGGTNPSLLRAMGAGAPCLAFAVSFNEDVLGPAGQFFATSAELAAALERAEESLTEQLQWGARSRERARRYDWDDVTDGYEALCRRLVGGRVRSASG